MATKAALSKNRYHTYILLCADGTYYTGHSKYPGKRFIRHLKGQGARYTKEQKPIRIVWMQSFETKKEARKREEQIKGRTREKKQKLTRGEWN